MLKNYLKVAGRSLRRHSIHTIVSVAGLAVGLAAFILIALLVVDELSFDRFHDKSEHIYRVVEVRSSPDMNETRAAYSSKALADAATVEIPEVRSAAFLIGPTAIGRRTAQHGERRFYESDYLLTDASVFEIFDFEVLRGHPSRVLSQPSTVVLTESGAAKYFGDVDPVGRILTFEQLGDLEVTGIMADPPSNSHLQFNMLISYSTMNQHERWIEWLEGWDHEAFLIYLELADGASPDVVSDKLASLFHSRREETETARSPYLQSLADIHFGSGDIDAGVNAHKGEWAYVYILIAIGTFIVIVGAINYMNMATARSMRRAREVGLRKVVGGHRLQLVGQFLTESVLASVIAIVIGLALVSIALPYFRDFLGRSFSLDLLTTPPFILFLIAVTLIVGLASGSYPALYLARFRPTHVLSGGTQRGAGAVRLRRVLVVTQFAVSIVMIVATWVVYNQLRYVSERELGFNEDRLVVIDINNGDVRRDWRTVRAAFGSVPGVEHVSTTSRVPGDWKDLTQIDVAVPGRSGLSKMSFIAIDDEFVETFEVDLLAGRGLSDEYGSDSSAVIINESAAELLGISSPNEDPIAVPASEFEGRVVGIVADFHFKSLHEDIGPLVLGYWNNPIRVIDYFTARVRGDNLAGTIAGLKEVGQRFDPSHPFEYNVLDERLDDFYREDERMGTIFGIAAILAILIACLGLAGLAAYTAEQRTKEIGVRKVLGASVRGIILLLSREFVILIGVAFVVAVPVAYVIMNKWLDGFAFRTEIGAGLFIGAGLVTLAIALATVSYQAVKSALADPVEALRYE